MRGSCRNMVPHMFHRCPQMSRGPGRWEGSLGWRPPPGRAQSGDTAPRHGLPTALCPSLPCQGESEPRAAPVRKGRVPQGPGAARAFPRRAQKAPHGWSEQSSVSPCTGCRLRHQPLSDLHWARVSQGFQNQCRWESRGGPSGPVLPRPGDLEPALLTVLEHERRPARRSHGAGSAELPGGQPAANRPGFCLPPPRPPRPAPPPPWLLLLQEGDGLIPGASEGRTLEPRSFQRAGKPWPAGGAFLLVPKS